MLSINNDQLKHRKLHKKPKWTLRGRNEVQVAGECQNYWSKRKWDGLLVFPDDGEHSSEVRSGEIVKFIKMAQINTSLFNSPFKPAWDQSAPEGWKQKASFLSRTLQTQNRIHSSPECCNRCQPSSLSFRIKKFLALKTWLRSTVLIFFSSFSYTKAKEREKRQNHSRIFNC